jgi:hypothetical protein
MADLAERGSLGACRRCHVHYIETGSMAGVRGLELIVVAQLL